MFPLISALTGPNAVEPRISKNTSKKSRIIRLVTETERKMAQIFVANHPVPTKMIALLLLLCVFILFYLV